MRLYTAFVVLFVFSVPVAAQSRTAVPKAVKSVENIEDIEIGMSADLVIAGLTKQGYTLDRFPTSPDPDTFSHWDVSSNGKKIGEFVAQKGSVTSAEVSVYNSTPGGAIDLAEALYWIFYDNGLTLPSKDRDLKETGTDAQFTTREIEMRTPGSSERMIFAHMKNGARYRISLLRLPPETPAAVFVDKLAPFVKKK